MAKSKIVWTHPKYGNGKRQYKGHTEKGSKYGTTAFILVGMMKNGQPHTKDYGSYQQAIADGWERK